ncbi:hypothetical protein D3C77_588810 [compost metagenome]
MALSLLLLDLGDGAGRRVVRAQALRRSVIEHIDEDCPGLVAGTGGQWLQELGDHADGDLVHRPFAEGGPDLLESHRVQVERCLCQFPGR